MLEDNAERLERFAAVLRIIDPEFSEERENFAQRYELIRRAKGIQLEEAREALRQIRRLQFIFQIGRILDISNCCVSHGRLSRPHTVELNL